MIPEQFTKKLKAWLDTPSEQKDYAEGAMMLLQLTHNKIMYQNNMRNLHRQREFITYQLNKHYKFRLQAITHQQVREMASQVDKIAKEHRLNEAEQQPKKKGKAVEWKAGKRIDHDTLPAEIQALYVENATIMKRMRELHLKLRTLSGRENTCPDSDRYPFLQEIIKLDKQYHKNWETYDHYNGNGSTIAENKIVDDYRLEQKRVQRVLNLLKGQYKKNPTEAKKEKIQNLFTQLASPSDKMIAELQSLNIIPKAE